MRFTNKALKEKRALKKEKKRQRMKRDSLKDLLPVDKEKWGADYYTCGSAPDYYYDKFYNCVSCGKSSIWTAHQQKYFFEELGRYMYAKAVHCHICCTHIKALKEDQQKHMAKVAEQQPHKNEAFFKKKF